MHFILLGILLGMGAAIPIGPVNLEMIRRNLNAGTPYGIMLGLGACGADVTYIVLISMGALALLQFPEALRLFGLVGSFILCWFAVKAWQAKTTDTHQQRPKPSLIRYGIEGYLITMLNPYTVLFWASISAQLSLIAATNDNGILFAGLGVVLGTVSWVIALNMLLHFTRHKLKPHTIKWLNRIGAIILFGFAIAGVVRAFT